MSFKFFDFQSPLMLSENVELDEWSSLALRFYVSIQEMKAS